MNKKINELKKQYENIEIPNELNEFVKMGIEKGGIEMKKRKKKISWIKGIASTAAVFTVFTVSVNTMPVFADSMSSIPGIAQLVKVLQFNKGTATGGKITDGNEVKNITSKDNKDSQTITIDISKDNMIQDRVPHFKVEYKKHPYTMTFTISGVRKLSAEKYFDALKNNKFVKDVYKITTLDDSMIRFNIMFNEAVKYEVTEYKNPARIVVNLTKDDKKMDETAYIIRTASYNSGEKFAQIEESLMGLEDMRVIKDEKGKFLIDTGAFDSEKEANKKIKELSKKYDSNIKFYIEKRSPESTPKFIRE